MIDSMETVGMDLAEARARIETIGVKLQAVIGSQAGDIEAARRSLEWLERLAETGAFPLA